MYTGSISMDQVAKIRFVNQKDYININAKIYDGRNMTMYPQSPTPDLKQFENSTNGNQWAINLTKADNSTLSAYDLSYMTVFNY